MKKQLKKKTTGARFFACYVGWCSPLWPRNVHNSYCWRKCANYSSAEQLKSASATNQNTGHDFPIAKLLRVDELRAIGTVTNV